MKITLGASRKRPAPDPDPPLTRFLTLGGAVTELRHCVFKTNYWMGRNTYRDPQEVNGFRWNCLGCGQDSKTGHYDPGYLDTEADKARNDANSHAARCRAMPPGDAS